MELLPPVKLSPPTSGLVRRTFRGERRRVALLQAAREVFLESGYEGASIEEVVRRVGGSKTSLYSYFGSKEGLFGDVVKAQCDEFLANLGIPTETDDDVEGTLRAIAHRFLNVFLDRDKSELFRIVVAEAARFPELAQRFFDSGPDRAHTQLGAYLRRQQAAGRIDCEDPEFAANVFLEMVKSTPHFRGLLGLPPFTDDRPKAQHVEQVVRLFLNGCGASGASRSRKKAGGAG
jgi:AcrR family transcriptional regulator